MSPSGTVMTRDVKDAPGPLVSDDTMFAPTIRSVGFVVVTAALALKALLPCPTATTSTGLIGAMPLYSAILISGNGTAALKVTLTTFVFAVEGAMLAA